MRTEPVVVVGAGPYGLAIAAHLHSQGIPVRVFGKPMAFWDNMPPGMHLKSVWSASSIADPEQRYTLSRYTESLGATQTEPVPLPYFADYGRWFQRQAVPDVEHSLVTGLERDGAGFRVELDDGRDVLAQRVIVATGIESFAHMPAFAEGLPKELVSHSQAHKDFTPFKGKTVAVLGRGQSAVQTAAFLHEAGADAEVIARGPIIWINRKLYRLPQPARGLVYPWSDVGPVGLNWVCHFPQFFRMLPEETRARIDQRAVRPAGAPWLKHRVVGLVRETSGVEIRAAVPVGDRLQIELSDGTSRLVDHLIAGTGYRPHIDRFGFIAPELRAAVQTVDGFPVLNGGFESSVANLYFVGAIASYNFGPLCRFVAGTRVTASQITHHIVMSSGERLAVAPEPVAVAPAVRS